MPFTPAQREHLERLLANEADMAFRRRVPVLLEYLELGDGTQVLDAGCGTGFYLVAIEALTGASTTGLDSDGGRLASAEGAWGSRKARSGRHPGTALRAGVVRPRSDE